MSKNLLRDVLSQEEIRKILATHPRRPLLPALDSEAWKKVARNPLLQPLAKSIRARAEKEADQSMPPLTDDLYLIFNRTGSRWEFEVVYFERRRQLARAAIALLLSDEKDPVRARLIPSLLTKLTDIFEEAAWAFPVHVKDSSQRDPLRTDLFCAETANLMTEMLDLFGSIIPAELEERILARLHEQIWENYLEQHKQADEWWWGKISNNWNAVCHQGVLGSALSRLDDDALLAKMLFKAKESLPIFLSGFGADGASSEGPGYWDYGFGWLTILNEQLEARTEGELSLFVGDDHVREIARFGPRTSLAGGHLLCFSDSPPIGVMRPANLFYLGERLDDSLCRDQALVNYAHILEKGLDLDFQRSDLLYLVRFFLRCPEKLPEKPSSTASKDIFMKDLAVVIAAGTDAKGHLWEFAAKGGHNNEHHNHNDCGNYILNIDANRFVTEIGQPLYTREFFGPERYQNLAARTLGHSLPIVNGCEQAAGDKFAVAVLDYSNTPQETKFVVDLAGCYPPEACCLKLIRTFHFEKSAGRLTVRDEFDLTVIRSAETAIVTVHPIATGKNSATISAGELNLVFRFEAGTVLAGIEDHPYRHHDPMITTPVAIQRIVLKPAVSGPKFTLGYTAELS